MVDNIVYREMRKWRTKLNGLCCQFLEDCSEKCDNDGFRRHFIKMSFDRIKRTIDRCRNEPFMQNERCRPNRHKEGPGLMFSHLDQIEHTTRIFLKTTDIELNEKFMEYFCRQCEECIKDAFDVFIGWFKYVNHGKEDNHQKCRSETKKKPTNRVHMAPSSGNTQPVKRNSPAECHLSVPMKKIKLKMLDQKDPSSVPRRILHSKQPVQSNDASRCIPEFRFSFHSAEKNRQLDVTKRGTDKNQTKSHQTVARSDKKTNSKSSDDKRSHDGQHKKSQNSENHSSKSNNPSSDQKKKKFAIEKEVNRKKLKATKRSGDEKHSKVNHTGTGSNKNTPNRSADDKRPNDVRNVQKKTLNPIGQKVNGERSLPFKHVDPKESDNILAKRSNQKTAVTDTIQSATEPHAGCLVYHCFDCKNVEKSTQFKNTNDVNQHYLSEHGTQSFKFYAVEMVICNHCDKVGTFEELKDHHSQMHPNEVFVILSGEDKNKCALCDYDGKLKNIHFKVRHSTLYSAASVFNPVRMSIANLQHLENIDHFICCQDHINPLDLSEHVQQHENTCPSCERYKSKDLFDLLVHLREAHNDQEYDLYLENYKKSLKNMFYSTQAIFANGLVLFNCNLAGTKYDRITEFIVRIEEWLNVLKLEFEQLVQKNHILKVIMPYIEGENIKMILGNLRRALGVQTSVGDILGVQRAPSNGAILIECRNSKFKNDIMTLSSTKKVYLTDLIDTSSVYSLPTNMNRPVTFE